MDYRKIIIFFKNNKKFIVIIIISIIVSKLFLLYIDNSVNKNIEQDLSLSMDLSEGKTIDKTSKNSLEMKHNEGTVNQGNTYNNTTINNHYSKEDKSIDVVYSDINITGKVVSKDNINEGIPNILVELVSPHLDTRTDKNGIFCLYKKQSTYVEIGQIRIKESSEYKKYNNDFDLNAKKVRIKLEKK